MTPHEELRELHDEHGSAVYRMLARCGLKPPAIDDAYQDTWLIAHVKGPPVGEYGPWIQGVARRVAYRYRRSEGRAAAVFVHEDLEGPAPSSDPERAAYGREAARALDVLDPREREAIVAAADGATAAEIAAESARPISEDGVYSRLRRARLTIRSRMKDDDDDKMVGVPPFDGERLWRRIEATITELDKLAGDVPGGESAASGPPSTPPLAVPLAPGIFPIAKAKLAGLLIGTFLVGTGTGILGTLAWCAHRHGPAAAHPAVEQALQHAPGGTPASPAASSGAAPPASAVAALSSPATSARPAAPAPASSYYPRLRKVGF